MINRIKIFTLMFAGITLLFVSNVGAQYAVKLADSEFELYNYSKAIDVYKKAYKQKQTLHTAQQLAKSYAVIRDYEQAEEWYAKALTLPNSSSENLLGYAKALQSNGKFAEAKTKFEAYFAADKNASAVQRELYLASCDFAIKAMANPKNVTVENHAHLNSENSDWGPFDYKDGVSFTSDRSAKVHVNNETARSFLKFDRRLELPSEDYNGWTGTKYLRWFFKDGQDDLKLFPVKTNTNYHVGSASFTANADQVYFTLTRIPETITKVKNEPSTIHVETYFAVRDKDGNWSEPVSFPLNNVNEYCIADPFISPDGNTLYFSSDMPGGKGGNDIYLVKKNADGTWGIPQNQTAINTIGNERSPALDANGKLFFASDGRVGLGGLDIYFLETSGDIVNLGFPVNSPRDDFAFFLNANGNIKYLSSDRSGGAGSDDIYFVEDKKQILPVKEDLVAKPAPDRVKVERPKDQFIIKNIYYDFNKFNIRPDAAIELDKIVTILEDYPELNIELGSHTDSRANDAYNLWLSNQRAKAAVEYLIEKGIAKNRLTWKGYGETQLLNRCANDVNCPAEDHQVNRRTEFKVIR
ncbi:OmpA family protein [Pedobacter namyangjuensis]|uniref:OmpA family protein n=1 Tax=Pedobacter namyangjuensis TaxID=600626 RepID=UPI001F070AFC|nr:OmpA family protein [Pedobacter namyangjuensis]